MKIIAALLLLATALPVLSQAAAAQQGGEVVDRIIAIVEDKAVLQSELELEYRNRLMQMERTMLTDAEKSELKAEIVEALVSELLMRVHAEKVGITIPDEEVFSEVEKRIEEGKRMIGGEDAFQKQLEREGLTVQQLRELWSEKLKTRMLSERLMYAEVMKDIRVTESEIRDYYNEHLDELPRRPATVSLAQILILPSASDDIILVARTKLEEIEKLLQAGGDFAELATEHSEGPSAKYGGSLGYIDLKDLHNPEFESAVRKLTVGEVSGPVLTEFGYHLIKLEDVSGEKVLVRHVLVKVESAEKDWESSARMAEELREKLLAGADFAEMVALHSADHRTKDSGGVVGDVDYANLPEHFRALIADIPAGGIAPVVKEEKGYRIVKILGREENRVYSFEEAREELKGLMENQRLQGRTDEYIEGLKAVYYVEVKKEQ
ncbi:MAG: peptidylprolyl isomerase [Candidatus Krumholzibacteria bacterium]|nr:peptidylprolyl isomerase [Candidatus Krumholzibacteria bacterium]